MTIAAMGVMGVMGVTGATLIAAGTAVSKRRKQ